MKINFVEWDKYIFRFPSRVEPGIERIKKKKKKKEKKKKSEDKPD